MSEAAAGHREDIAFAGKRVRHTSTSSYEAVLARLRAGIGELPFEALREITGEREEYAAQVKRHEGDSGFMRMVEMDHGPWIAKFGVNRRACRWIFGNPLIAITMIRHDINAGLFVPLDLLLVENENGEGCYVLYVEPSSLIAVEDNPPLLDAVLALDAKVAAFVGGATAAPTAVPG